eukprot:364976-Chlamydomonas_euryale.AAC.19
MAGTPRSRHSCTWLVCVSCGAYDRTTWLRGDRIMSSAPRPHTPAPSSSTVRTAERSTSSGSISRNLRADMEPPSRGRTTDSGSTCRRMEASGGRMCICVLRERGCAFACA